MEADGKVQIVLKYKLQCWGQWNCIMQFAGL